MAQNIPNEFIFSNIGKYNFEYNKFVLPLIKDAEALKKHESESSLQLITPHINLEPFKNEFIPLKPSICTFAFMSECEVIKVKTETDFKKLYSLFDEKLNNINIKGTPKKLLIELFISVINFCNKNTYNASQTGAMLGMFYNTHLYMSYNLFATPEEIYNLFKEYIYCHSVSVPPYKTKIYEPKEANQLMTYFCNIYLRNLCLIRYLMFPNYNLLLRIKNPPEEDPFPAKVKGKGKDKKKK